MPNLARESLGVNCQTAALEKGTKFLTLKSRKFGHFASVVVWNILSLSTQDHNIRRPFNFQLLWCEIIDSLDVSTKSSAKELALFFSHISVSHLTHGMVYPFSQFLHWEDGDSSWGQWFTLFVLFYSTENIHVKFLLQALHPISISTETNQNWRVSTSAT